jgi:hypothetical protein
MMPLNGRRETETHVVSVRRGVLEDFALDVVGDAAKKRQRSSYITYLRGNIPEVEIEKAAESSSGKVDVLGPTGTAGTGVHNAHGDGLSLRGGEFQEVSAVGLAGPLQQSLLETGL